MAQLWALKPWKEESPTRWSLKPWKEAKKASTVCWPNCGSVKIRAGMSMFLAMTKSAGYRHIAAAFCLGNAENLPLRAYTPVGCKFNYTFILRIYAEQAHIFLIYYYHVLVLLARLNTWLIYATLSELYLQAISDQSSLLIIMTCVLWYGHFNLSMCVLIYTMVSY